MSDQSTEESSAQQIEAIPLSDLEWDDVPVARGGQAVVFKGRWISRDKTVAIKKPLAADYQEVEILGALDHPNIIKLYGIAQERNDLYIVTEFADKGSLHDCLILNRHSREFSFDERLNWAGQIAEGMKYLHQKKIIHRDLKPMNILMTGTVPIWSAKLCDLGTARKYETTTTVTALGTFRWMAPEVLKGEGVSLSCDVYSYGMILWELLTSEEPFSGVSSMLVPARIVSGNQPDIPDSCESDLAQLMKTCWDMNPKARPTFEHIVSALSSRSGTQGLENDRREDPSLTSDMTTTECEGQRPEVAQVEEKPTTKALTDPIVHPTASVLTSSTAKDDAPSSLSHIEARPHPEFHSTASVLSGKESGVKILTSATSPSMREEVHQPSTAITKAANPKLQEQSQDDSRLKKKPITAKSIYHPGAPLKWKRCADLPTGRTYAQSVVMRNKVYLRGGYSPNATTESHIFIYDFTKDAWQSTETPTRNFALTTYQDSLVMVGGKEVSTGNFTNQLRVLDDEEGTWTEPYPPMPTPRDRATAASSQIYLVVAGGRNIKSLNLDVVEVYNGQLWISTYQLPKRCSLMKSTVLDDCLYLIGGSNQGKSVFQCSIQLLFSHSSQQHSVWKTLPNLPYEHCSIANFGGALVAIGGERSFGRYTNTIFVYNPTTGSWMHGGEMPVSFSNTCALVLPGGEMLVVGGVSKRKSYSSLVYNVSLEAQ